MGALRIGISRIIRTLILRIAIGLDFVMAKVRAAFTLIPDPEARYGVGPVGGRTRPHRGKGSCFSPERHYLFQALAILYRDFARRYGRACQQVRPTRWQRGMLGRFAEEAREVSAIGGIENENPQELPSMQAIRGHETPSGFCRFPSSISETIAPLCKTIVKLYYRIQGKWQDSGCKDRLPNPTASQSWALEPPQVGWRL